jgi:2-phospho-L-lactate/phosphoenolpyruvate guanylyltransferase
VGQTEAVNGADQLSTGHHWQAVLPVKGGPTAKSRLRHDIERTAVAAAWAGTEIGYAGGTALSGALGTAIAQDTVAATVSCPAITDVIVVTADSAVRQWVGDGAQVVRESRPGAGLLSAVADGLAASRPGPVVVLLADLPALRPTDLTAALAGAHAVLHGPDAPLMVAFGDADGRGTVLLAARQAADLSPAFGPDSLRLHRRRGALPVTGGHERLRRDVDTVADLRVAAAMGLGSRTRAILASGGSWLTEAGGELEEPRAC